MHEWSRYFIFARPVLQGEAEAKAGEGAEKKAPEEDYYIYANVLLNWGNILYERSQLAARAGQVTLQGPPVLQTLHWEIVWVYTAAGSITSVGRWRLVAHEDSSVQLWPADGARAAVSTQRQQQP